MTSKCSAFDSRSNSLQLSWPVVALMVKSCCPLERPSKRQWTLAESAPPSDGWIVKSRRRLETGRFSRTDTVPHEDWEIVGPGLKSNNGISSQVKRLASVP